MGLRDRGRKASEQLVNQFKPVKGEQTTVDGLQTVVKHIQDWHYDDLQEENIRLLLYNGENIIKKRKLCMYCGRIESGREVSSNPREEMGHKTATTYAKPKRSEVQWRERKRPAEIKRSA